MGVAKAEQPVALTVPRIPRGPGTAVFAGGGWLQGPPGALGYSPIPAAS